MPRLAAQSRTAAKRAMAKQDNEIAKLLDRIVSASSDSVVTAYERRITQLEREKLVLEEQAARQARPQRSFEHMFERVLSFVSNPANLWKSGALAERTTALRLLFKAHLVYGRETGFRTPETSSTFKVLGGLSEPKKAMADRVGFEPTVSVNPRRFSRPLP